VVSLWHCCAMTCGGDGDGDGDDGDGDGDGDGDDGDGDGDDDCHTPPTSAAEPGRTPTT